MILDYIYIYICIILYLAFPLPEPLKSTTYGRGAVGPAGCPLPPSKFNIRLSTPFRLGGNEMVENCDSKLERLYVIILYNISLT